MYRTWVIARHTFFEAIAQPIYSLLLAVGAAILLLYALLPFFTLGEDTVMFKAVGLDVILLLVLIVTLFATSKSIHEEIEDRTMLTLTSKPVSRLQVLLGKYFGLVMAAALAVGVLGIILMVATWLRIPNDYLMAYKSLDERDAQRLWDIRMMHLSGLLPSLALMWMSISVLAAISVAISTRFSLVVNLPTVILIYLAGNLTRFLGDALAGSGAVTRALAWTFSTVLPFLEVFDLSAYTVYGQIGLSGSNTAQQATNVASLGFVWGNTAIAALYALFYITFALSAGLFVFQNRELGGSEG